MGNLVAGDGIEPSLPAYETGLEPLQLSRSSGGGKPGTVNGAGRIHCGNFRQALLTVPACFYTVLLFGCQISVPLYNSLAQGEGLEPPPTGLESAMLPAYTNPVHSNFKLGPEPRHRTSNLLVQSQACYPFHQLGS